MGALMEYSLGSSLHYIRAKCWLHFKPLSHFECPNLVLGFWGEERRARVSRDGLSVCSRGELCPPCGSGCKHQSSIYPIIPRKDFTRCISLCSSSLFVDFGAFLDPMSFWLVFVLIYLAVTCGKTSKNIWIINLPRASYGSSFSFCSVLNLLSVKQKKIKTLTWIWTIVAWNRF